MDGNNELRSGYGHAGLEKRDKMSSGVLSINDKDKNGSLYARGGGDDDAGIGGVHGDGGGNITINGGTIVARKETVGVLRSAAATIQTDMTSSSMAVM